MTGSASSGTPSGASSRASSGSPDAAPYERLAELFEIQLQLAGEGRLAELQLATEECTAFIATLPAVPPPAAAAALQRATLIHKRLQIECQRAREALHVAAATVDAGRRALTGYAPPRRRAPRVHTLG
jgi:hypothetical protein